jgi:hypothetical protein
MGVRNGASVSTRTFSKGVTCSASLRLCAFLNVQVPAKDKYHPLFTNSCANSLSPEKQ